jgi:two-component sensor histidine kinase
MQDKSESVGWLQRAVGTIIAGGSVLTAALSFIDYTAVLGHTPLYALGRPAVWLALVFALAAFLTTLRVGAVSQWIQITGCFLTAIVSASTSTLADLTSLVFVGFGFSLGMRYRRVAGNVWRFFVPATAVYLGVWIYTNLHIAGGPVIQVLLSSAAAAMLLLLTFAIIKSIFLEQQTLQGKLKRTVRQRTLELETALEQQRQLSNKNEVLLRELHHRTKNNLQIIASLLFIQRSRIDDARRRATAVLEQAEQRIQTLAATHEMFHRTDRPDMVNLGEYIRFVAAAFSHTSGALELHLDDTAVEIPVNMDTAVLLGLILNELMTNVVEHAYPADMVKPLWITLKETGSSLIIHVTDRGLGIPDHVVLNPPETAGMEIINALVAQLKGTLQVTRKPHAVWHIELVR